MEGGRDTVGCAACRGRLRVMGDGKSSLFIGPWRGFVEQNDAATVVQRGGCGRRNQWVPRVGRMIKYIFGGGRRVTADGRSRKMALRWRDRGIECAGVGVVMILVAKVRVRK